MQTLVESNQKVTESVRSFLLKKAWPQRRLAKAMDITESELSLLLSGRRKWSLRYILRFTEATGRRIVL